MESKKVQLSNKLHLFLFALNGGRFKWRVLIESLLRDVDINHASGGATAIPDHASNISP